ncbi:MAG TPA: metallophosphoesterase [Polyangiaceae bacterium]|jgi:3',5'-cyclic AMP phosphodiesterase CpdA
MRIAHFSDLHVLALDGVGVARYLNKRLTGVANLALRRAPLDELTGAWRAAAERVPSRLRKKDFHRTAYVRSVAREIARTRVDHVVITGDVTNLALEPEFVAARTILEGELHLGPRDVSLVPGNHDLYTRGALRNRRFTQFFADYTRSDLDVGVDIGAGHFPYVKLRGPVAIIGLSSAVPKPAFIASGELGQSQLDALSRALGHAEVRKRTPVILLHHPPIGPRSRVDMLTKGLRDAAELRERLRAVPRGLVLHGHLHKRVQSTLATDTGELLVVGATSASLHHEHAARMSGFNVYDFGDDGALRSIEAHVLDPSKEKFRRADVPIATGAHW